MFSYQVLFCLLLMVNCSTLVQSLIQVDGNLTPVEVIDTSELVRIYRYMKYYSSWLVGRNVGRRDNAAKLRALYPEKFQKVVPDKVSFPCSVNGTRSTKRPESVHKLRPGDIDLIGAIGDSITVGTAILTENLVTLLFDENRGLSFISGGQRNWREFLTLPNILKEYNPNLIGYSLGDSFTTDKESQFNVAEAGSVSRNTPYMTEVLIKRIRNDPRVDVKNDWKMITYFIGHNDFCSVMCFKKNPEEILEEHAKDILYVLRALRKKLPRTIVNVLPPANLKLIRWYNKKPFVCDYITHSFSCPCIFGLVYQNRREFFNELMTKWQKLDFKISKLVEFDRDDFTVVFQPWPIGYYNLGNAGPNKITDYTYKAADCFHFSQKGNALFANFYWNNLLEPLGKKSVRSLSKLFETFKCPTEESPYIFTIRNSGIQKPSDYNESCIDWYFTI